MIIDTGKQLISALLHVNVSPTLVVLWAAEGEIVNTHGKQVIFLGCDYLGRKITGYIDNLCFVSHVARILQYAVFIKAKRIIVVSASF